MSKRFPWAKWTLPETIDPPRLCYTVPVPDDPFHRAAFRGALLSLASASKWEDDNAHTAKAAAAVWMDIYDQVVACEPGQPNIESWDEDLTSLCEGLRWQDGKLQALCCGTWSDIAGQPTQGWQVADPGPGATQPAAGGGCASYKGTLPGNGYFYVPTIVNTGDTIQITNLLGATYDPATAVAWLCGDGGQFFAGANIGLPYTAGGNPMPAVPSGTVIAKINGVFYDVHTGIFTVPAGVSNKPVVLQINYAAIAGSSGSLSFDIQVCNNVAGTFTHTFDFTLNNGGFTVPALGAGGTGSNGVYTPGVGWSAGLAHYPTNSYRICQIERTLSAARTIRSIQDTYVVTLGTTTGAAINDEQYTLVGAAKTVRGASVFTAIPPSPWYSAFTAAGVTAVGIALISGSVAGAVADPGGTVTLTKRVVTGDGTDPF